MKCLLMTLIISTISPEILGSTTPDAPTLAPLDKSSASVHLIWDKPFDPIKQFVIEYKKHQDSWDSNINRVTIRGDLDEAHIQGLEPATTYNFRIIAENENGASGPSNIIKIITYGDIPTGVPQNISVESTSQTSLRVRWKPPIQSEWNGQILGYYVGYKSSVRETYVFEIVNHVSDDDWHALDIDDLNRYTQYSVVVQAYNKIGPGPLSDEIKQFTAEGAPTSPPKSTTCRPLTSETIRVTWNPPPLDSVNGIIKGYKVIYGRSELWKDESSKKQKKTSGLFTALSGLQKYSNYTIQVLAFTSGGDGVRSDPIRCETDQDTPDAPAAVRALISSSSSVLVIWKPPINSNGILRNYIVYVKNNDIKQSRQIMIPATQQSHDVTGLNANQEYEFFVSAITLMGEGQASEIILATPNEKVPTKIASFDGTFEVGFNEEVKLPCLAVGVPKPDIKWKFNGNEVQPSDKIEQLTDGSLHIKRTARQDSGEYTCEAGKESLTHKLNVLAPPEPPKLTFLEAGVNYITVGINKSETEILPITGFTINYKSMDYWYTIEVPADTQNYTIKDLRCGAQYQIRATASNSIGVSKLTNVMIAKAKGSEPVQPEKSKFIVSDFRSATLKLPEWNDGGCRIFNFIVEICEKNSHDWDRLSNNVKPNGDFIIPNLQPATKYELRVTAQNDVGVSLAFYDFATKSGTIPNPPALTLLETSSNSITIALKMSEADTIPIDDYTLYYKPQFGSWDTEDLPADTQNYTIKDLYCGTQYEVYADSHNPIGMSNPSYIMVWKTTGSKPIKPSKSRFLESGSTSVTLKLPAWNDGGCKISYFVVEVRKKNSRQWELISNNVRHGGNFVVLDLESATKYVLKITAYNDAGYTIAHYDFETLTLNGGKVEE